jgi:kinetochore protein Mis12/MTW1
VLQTLTSLETGLLTIPPEELGFKAVKSLGENGAEEVEFPDAKQELEEGLHKLETLLYSAVDKNFDKFEIYVLRNILSVPAELVNWVRLSHYEVGCAPQQQLSLPTDSACRTCRIHFHRMRLPSKVYSYCEAN